MNQQPKRAPESWFHFAPTDISLLPSPLQAVIEPPPSASPPVGFTFPRSLQYHVQATNQYQRGYFAVANFETSTKNQVKSQQMRMLLPPQLKKEIGEFNTPYQHPSVPGCVQLQANLPMAQMIDGDPDICLSVAGLQTLASMKQVLGSEAWCSFRSSFTRLAQNTWGTAERKPFYTIPGLKRNDRSAKNHSPNSYDGSYNLASTVIKGDGQGTVAPAVQAHTAESAVQLQEIIEDLVHLGR